MIILSLTGLCFAQDTSLRENPHWAECSNKCGRCDYSAENPCTEKILRCVNQCISEKEAKDQEVKKELDFKIVAVLVAAVSFLVVVPVSLYFVRKAERKHIRREKDDIKG